MTLPLPQQTEKRRDDAVGLDLATDQDVLGRLLQGQVSAVSAVEARLPEIANAAGLMAETVRRGGCLHYAAAGSSGLMALADAAELPGTFGLASEQVAFWMAGGVPDGAKMPGHTEDDDADALRAASHVRAHDLAIALSASGSTPFAVAFAQAARAAGARTICIANNADAPLFQHASCAIHLETPPELIAGSTRMGAATAQKATLNLMSTLMGIRLGHVHDGLMVNVVADNQKLRKRAEGIVRSVAGVSSEDARDTLDQAAGNVKQAILLAAGADSPAEARRLLEQTGGHLRPALKQL